MSEIDRIVGQLDHIAEELADRAIDALRAAVVNGERRSEEERRLTRARRAVERASSILRDQDVD
jgi:hypothetical protein